MQTALRLQRLRATTAETEAALLWRLRVLSDSMACAYAWDCGMVGVEEATRINAEVMRALIPHV